MVTNRGVKSTNLHSVSKELRNPLFRRLEILWSERHLTQLSLSEQTSIFIRIESRSSSTAIATVGSEGCQIRAEKRA